MDPKVLADLAWVRSIMTAVLLLGFIALVAWAYSAGRRPGFDAAARMPLEDDPAQPIHPKGRSS